MKALISIIFFVQIILTPLVCMAAEEKIEFKKDEVVKIEHISSIVNKGVANFLKRKNPAAKVKGEFIYLRNNGQVYNSPFCSETIDLPPKLKIPVNVFYDSKVSFNDHKEFWESNFGKKDFDPNALAWQIKGQFLFTYMGKTRAADGSIVDEKIDGYIISGDKGAKLKKVKDGLVLIKGEAYYLKNSIN